MAVFLKPNRGVTFTKNVKLDLTPGLTISQAESDRYCMSLISDGIAGVLDKEGEPIKDSLLKSGQRVNFKLGTIGAQQYHVMVIPNPEIARHAYVGGPLLLEPYQEESLDFMVKVERQFDLAGLDHLFKIYLVD